MVQTITSNIISTAILSDCGLYRYQLTRTWNDNKRKATVIMLNPSKADMLKTDKTIMNVNNFLIENDYGSMTVVNLFAFMQTDKTKLKYREADHEELNDDYLIDAFDTADTIIIAWTRGDYKIRKKEVLSMLNDYWDKVKCFMDSEGKILRHPRDLGEKWTLVDVDFATVKSL